MSFTPDDAKSTYRALRIALVALVIFLGASVIETRLSAGCWQGSISATFYTAGSAARSGDSCGHAA